MTKNEGERPVNIIRGSIDSLTFYEVTEDELSILENGPSSSIYLNLTIALISVSASFFATLFTVQISNTITFIVFLVIALVTMITGMGYLITWFKSRSSYGAVIKRIKARAGIEPQSVITAADSITVLPSTASTVNVEL